MNMADVTNGMTRGESEALIYLYTVYIEQWRGESEQYNRFHSCFVIHLFCLMSEQQYLWLLLLFYMHYWVINDQQQHFDKTRWVT